MGDEYHYIMECKAFTEERKQLLPDVCTQRPNIHKFNNYLVQKTWQFRKSL